MDSFNAVDIGVAAIILLSAVMAYARGFVHEVLAIGGWVGAAFATIYGYPHLKPLARQIIPVDLLADIAAGVAIFIVSLVAFSLISRPIAKGVKESALNMLDRSLGFLFGILRGVVIVCLAYLLIEWATPPKEQPQWLRSARSMPMIEVGVGLMKSLVPENTLAGEKVEGAREKAEKIIESEAEKAFKRMISPEPKGTGAKSAPDGYGDAQRREMDRAIESAQ